MTSKKLTFCSFGLLLLLSSPLFGATEPSNPLTNCSTTREYVTALEFLRGRQDFALAEPEARKIASTISEGCSGAAARFIRVVSVLTHSGMTSVDAFATGFRFSALSDTESETFTAIFKRAYLPEGLDLDLRAAMKLALALSAEFKGNREAVQDDFARLVDFCISGKSLDLPRPECAVFAARITHLGENWEKGTSQDFFETLEFLRSEKGPALITGQALALAEQIISAGPGAPNNFMQAYRYGISAKGLNLGTQEALKFAQEMAKRRTAQNTNDSKEK